MKSGHIIKCKAGSGFRDISIEMINDIVSVCRCDGANTYLYTYW